MASPAVGAQAQRGTTAPPTLYPRTCLAPSSQAPKAPGAEKSLMEPVQFSLEFETRIEISRKVKLKSPKAAFLRWAPELTAGDGSGCLAEETGNHAKIRA